MKLKIEGKLRDGFFEWFTEEHGMNMPYHIEFWEGLPQSAQFGLIQEYADSLGIFISINYAYNVTMQGSDWFSVRVDNKYVINGVGTRPEAQVAAIEKLNEIVNHD